VNEKELYIYIYIYIYIPPLPPSTSMACRGTVLLNHNS
jgi:hypothetical protein